MAVYWNICPINLYGLEQRRKENGNKGTIDKCNSCACRHNYSYNAHNHKKLTPAHTGVLIFIYKVQQLSHTRTLNNIISIYYFAYIAKKTMLNKSINSKLFPIKI